MQQNDKIAQVIFLPLVQIEKLQWVDKQNELKASDKGNKGFGSSDWQHLETDVEKLNLSVGTLTNNQQKQFENLLEKYQNLFSNELGKCDIVMHEIEIGRASCRERV